MKDPKAKTSASEPKSAPIEAVLKTVMGVEHICHKDDLVAQNACPRCAMAEFFNAKRQKTSS